MSEFRPAGWPVFLVVSLVLNGLLAGFLLGGGLGRNFHATPHAMHAERGGISMIHGLDQVTPDESRGQLRRAFRKAFEEARPQRLAQREARQALIAAIAAEPFDEAAVRAAFADLRSAETAFETGLHETIADEIALLTPEQRAVLAGSMERRRLHLRRGAAPDLPR